MTSVYLQLPDSEIRKIVARHMPNEKRMVRVGRLLHQQVKERFETAGASGGTPWPERWLSGLVAGKPLMGGTKGDLFKSFYYDGDADSAEVWSDDPHSLVHQLGTRGKNGTLPDIKPKHAKALFIPITDKAKNSKPMTKDEAAYLSQKHGDAYEEKMRAGIRYLKNRSMLATFTLMPLVKGRIKNGKLQKWDATTGQYVNGTPDFVLLKKVSLAKRQMLPDSDGEQKVQGETISEILS